ncbi:hypothetical protein BC826DRAFT_981457 [Russula brevipes]|nr:hypothetical protein BC826DRAFT_981457 [Russula brevipes]
MALYLLIRVADSEQWGVKVSFHPKPLQGDWNAVALAATLTIEPGGIQAIQKLLRSCRSVTTSILLFTERIMNSDSYSQTCQ